MWPDNETTEDLLGFRVHADLLRAIVTNPAMLPVSIGIFGDWGSGKTSVMKMLERDLDPDNHPEGSSERNKYNNVGCLYFNGWLFEGYDDAKSAILESVLSQLAEHKRLGPKVRGKVSELLRSVDYLRAGRLLARVALPAVAAYATGGASLIPSALMSFAGISNTSETSEDDAKRGNASTDAVTGADLTGIVRRPGESIPATVRTFRRDFEKLLADADITSLIVLIDDLDRCSPERIIDNLEAIKLFLNVPRTAFVIGADPRIVRHAIATRYKPVQMDGIADDAKEAEGLIRDYLEKLIQVPYHLSRLSPAEVETYMTLLFCRRDLEKDHWMKCQTAYEQQRQSNRYAVFSAGPVRDALGGEMPATLSASLTQCCGIAQLITEGLKGNPRQVKRFLNAFTLRRQLADVAGLQDLRNDVLVKLMVLEYSREDLFRQLYEWQAAEDGHPRQLRELEDAVRAVDGAKRGETHTARRDGLWSDEFAGKWLRMEPELSEVDLRDYYWVSRDRLRSTLSGVALVSPIVRRAVDDLLSDNSGRNQQGIKVVAELDETERRDVLLLIQQHHTRKPAEKSSYRALRKLAEANVSGSLPVLAMVLMVSPADVPSGEGPALQNLMEQVPAAAEALKGVLETLAKTDTKFGKALSVRAQKRS